MRIKTITAASMPEALRIIRSELGEGAVILSTQKTKQADGTIGLTLTVGWELPTQKDSTTPAASPRSGAAGGGIINPVSFIDILHAHGLAPDSVARLSGAIKGLDSAGFSAADGLEMVLGKLIPFTPVVDFLPRGKVHIFVGPTGAGKTTTISKLAVQAHANGASVGLMSMDDQKIGGFEPLEIMASVLGEAAFLVRDRAELLNAAQQLGKRSMVFIDTPGVSPYAPQGIAMLTERITALGITPLVHLVLPATLNPQESPLLPLAFQPLNPTRIIFSKLDETAYMGGVLNVALSHPLQVGVATDSPSASAEPLLFTAKYMAQILTKKPKKIWEAQNAPPPPISK